MSFRPKSRCYISFPRQFACRKFSDDNLSGDELQEGPMDDKLRNKLLERSSVRRLHWRNCRRTS
jgi:hypothetical protein